MAFIKFSFYLTSQNHLTLLEAMFCNSVGHFSAMTISNQISLWLISPGIPAMLIYSP